MMDPLPLRSALAKAIGKNKPLTLWDIARLETALWHDNVYANHRRYVFTKDTAPAAGVSLSESFLRLWFVAGLPWTY